jgi:hypothetical protein
MMQFHKVGRLIARVPKIEILGRYLLLASLCVGTKSYGQIAIAPSEAVFKTALSEMTDAERLTISSGFGFSLSKENLDWVMPGKSLERMFKIDYQAFVAFFDQKLSKPGTLPLRPTAITIKELEMMDTGKMAYRFWIEIRERKTGGGVFLARGFGKGDVFSVFKVWRSDTNPLSIESANDGFMKAFLRAFIDMQEKTGSNFP